MNDIGVIEAIGGFLLLLNIFVSLQLLMARDLTNTQKSLQLLIVWLIPLFGAVGIFLMRRSDREPRGPNELLQRSHCWHSRTTRGSVIGLPMTVWVRKRCRARGSTSC
jgi:hypothetical protein